MLWKSSEITVPALQVTILTCNRVTLLNQTLASVASISDTEHVTLHVWVDMPLKRPHTREHTIQLLRSLPSWYSIPNVQVRIFEEHYGTRAIWLTALSVRRSQLILEDDVMLLSRAVEWYRWSYRAMHANHNILGTSYQGQSTIARPGGRRRLYSKVPYTYPLVGSHGFMLSPHVYDQFFEALRTRLPSSLLIPNLITTNWYKEFKNKGLTNERMWTQEMVAFAYHNNMTTLYPPTAMPFSVHCARDHGVDKTRCKWAYPTRPATRTALWNHARIRELTWDATCVQNCLRPWSWFVLNAFGM